MAPDSSRSSSRRRRLREAVVRVLYAVDVSGTDPRAAVDRYADTLSDGPTQAELGDWVMAVMGRLEEVDERIRSASANWKLERMAAVDRCIIRLGTWELLARPEIPARATINEAIEIARRYGSEESTAFVNGVLDRVAREIPERRAEVES